MNSWYLLLLGGGPVDISRGGNKRIKYNWNLMDSEVRDVSP